MNADASGDAPGSPPAPAIIVEQSDALAVVRINRPAQRNSLSVATLEALDAALSTLLARPRISSIIFTGTDDVFASGADIRELSELDRASAAEFARRGQRLFGKIADARQLTVAAINGHCLGGGLDLALSCSIRCASRGAVFAHPGARLGIITGWGGTQRLTRLIGPARALEMFTTARRISGTEAYEMGLVDRLCESALACALEIAAAHALRLRPLAEA